MRLRTILAFVLSIFIISFGGRVMASESDITIIKDGEDITSSISFFIEDGVTFVNARDLFEVMNMDVTWDSKSRVVTAVDDNNKLEVTIGSSNVVINGVEKTTKYIPKIVNERTYIPLRVLTETLRGSILWDEHEKTITITSPQFVEADTEKYSYRLENSAYKVDVEKLHSEYETENNLGYYLLKGHPLEDKINIYYMDKGSTFQVMTEQVGYDPDEMVNWQENGITYRNKKSEVYDYFTRATELINSLDTQSSIVEFNRLESAFGGTYKDWAQLVTYSEDAESLVDMYLHPDKYQTTNLDATEWQDEMEYTMTLPENIYFDKSPTTGKWAFRTIDTSALPEYKIKTIYEIDNMSDSFMKTKNNHGIFNDIDITIDENGQVFFSKKDLVDKGILDGIIS